MRSLIRDCRSLRWSSVVLVAVLVVARCASATTIQNPGHRFSQPIAIGPLSSEDAMHVVAQINGSAPLTFLIDSASTSAITSASAGALQLHPAASLDDTTVTGVIRAPVVRTPVVVTLFGAKVEVAKLLVLDSSDPNVSSVMHGIDGILGRDLFDHFVVDIDYSARMLRLFEPRTYIHHGAGAEIPLDLINGEPRVRGTITAWDSKEISGEFEVDTAAQATLSLTMPFTLANGLAPQEQTSPPIPFVGLAGVYTSRIGSFRSVAIGPYKLRRPTCEFIEAKGGVAQSVSISGLLGEGFLRCFEVIIDCRHHTLFLKPNASYAQSNKTKITGMCITADQNNPRRAMVAFVMPFSPAARAGIRRGDLVTAINGAPVSGEDLRDVARMLNGRKKEVLVRIERSLDHGKSLTGLVFTMVPD